MSDFCILVGFDDCMRCYKPLGLKSKLGSEKFPVPVSIILGDYDWVQKHDKGASKKIVLANKKIHGHESNYYECPSSGHTMNLDNPDGWANFVINEVFFSDPSKKD